MKLDYPQTLNAEEVLWILRAREEHPSAKEVFERCVVEDPSASVPAKRLFSVMQENGYEDNHKALKLFLEEQYRNHAFVKVKRPKNKLTWSGLRVLDEYE